jgi:hypothetical protein
VNGLDAILLLLLAAPALLGLWKGIVGPACVLGSLALGAWLGLRLAGGTAPLLVRLGVSERWAPLLAFLAVFLGVMVAGALLSYLLVAFLRRVHLRWIERLLGCAAGLTAGLLAGAALVVACTGFWPEGEGPKEGSLLAPHIARATRQLLLPALPEEWRSRMAPRLEGGAAEPPDRPPKPPAG